MAGDIPADMEGLVAEKRRELVETVSEVDDVLAEKFLNDEPVSAAELEVLFFFIWFLLFNSLVPCSVARIITMTRKANSLHET